MNIIFLLWGHDRTRDFKLNWRYYTLSVSIRSNPASHGKLKTYNKTPGVYGSRAFL